MSLLEHKEAKVLLEDAEVSAGTVRGCRRRLTGFLKRYLPLFYRQEQREHAQLVIQGRLSHLERKTCEPDRPAGGSAAEARAGVCRRGQVGRRGGDGRAAEHVAEAFHDPGGHVRAGWQRLPEEGDGVLWRAAAVVRPAWEKWTTARWACFWRVCRRGAWDRLGRRLYLPREWAESAGPPPQMPRAAGRAFCREMATGTETDRASAAGAARLGRGRRRIRPRERVAGEAASPRPTVCDGCSLQHARAGAGGRPSATNRRRKRKDEAWPSATAARGSASMRGRRNNRRRVGSGSKFGRARRGR